MQVRLDDGQPPATRTLTLERGLRWGILTILGMCVVSFLGQLLRYETHLRGRGLLAQVVSLDDERSIGTVYAGLQLLVCAAAAAITAVLTRRQGRRWARHWAGVAVVLTLVGLDEHMTLHERLNQALKSDTGDVSAVPWVVPAMAAVVLLVGLFARFVAALPHPVRRLVIAAATLFVAGAAGLEEVGQRYTDHVSSWWLPTVAISTLEEACELVAITLMLYAIARYVRDQLSPVRLSVSVGDVG